MSTAFDRWPILRLKNGSKTVRLPAHPVLFVARASPARDTSRQGTNRDHGHEKQDAGDSFAAQLACAGAADLGPKVSELAGVQARGWPARISLQFCGAV